MKEMGIAMGELMGGGGAIEIMQICTMCQYEGKAKIQRYGSLLGELFMWGTTGVTLILGFVMPFMSCMQA